MKTRAATVVAAMFAVMGIVTGAWAAERPTVASRADEIGGVIRPPEIPDDLPAARPTTPPAGAIEHQGPWMRGSFASVQVNVNAMGQNIVGDAANEPSMAIDPTNPNRIVIGWRQFDTITSNFRQAGWSYSHDGGETWTFPGVIQPGVFRSDPVLGADSAGNIYYLSLTEDFLCRVFKSTDGGVSWNNGTAAFGGDKPWMIIDRTGGVGDGNIYAKWQTFFNCCGPDTFTRSANDNASYMFPVSVPLGPTFGTLDVGPDGAVYAAGIRAVTFQDPNTLVMARSSNAQEALQQPVFELAQQVDLGGSLGFGGGPNPDGLQGQVQIVTDHSHGATAGNVYMLCSVDPPGSDPLDVMFARSTDGGATWDPPVRVNDDPIGTNAWQWFGTISVAPNGRIDVMWNDTRNTGQVNLCELHYSFSTDGGETWSVNEAVSPVFNSYLGWPNQNKMGDYYHMISQNNAVNIAYSATFNGEQDVYYLRIEHASAVPGVSPWGAIIMALCLTAAMAVAIGRMRRTAAIA